MAAVSLAEAIEVLASDGDAKVIAGGQSLMPLLALRLARPSVLVDIAGLGLDQLVVPLAPSPALENSPASENSPALEIGAMVRHRRVEHDPQILRWAPLLAEAASQVGYPAIRNRGTVGGSLAHADPAAELPVAVMALEGTVVASGCSGERRIPAARFADGFLSTTLEDDEVLTAVQVRPAGPGHGAAFCEWAPRHHDFADAGVAVALELGGDGQVVWFGAAASGLDSCPRSLVEVFTDVGLGEARDAAPPLLRAVAEAVAGLGRGADEDRAELAGLLAARAVRLAWARAAGAGRAERRGSVL